MKNLKYNHERGFTETSLGLDWISSESDYVYTSLSKELLVEIHLQPCITLRKWIYKSWQDGCWPSKVGWPQILLYLALEPLECSGYKQKEKMGFLMTQLLELGFHILKCHWLQAKSNHSRSISYLIVDALKSIKLPFF